MKRLVGVALLSIVVGACASGPPAARDLPDVVGLQYGRALGEFTKTGVCLGNVTAVRNAAPMGTVLAQSPKAGVSVSTGYVVGLEVSKGDRSDSIADRLASSPGCERAFYVDGPG